MASEQIAVDIATRVVGPDEDIFVMQPGEGYWLYDAYERFNRVFLDFPGLDLAFERPPPTDKLFREMIVRSIAINEWLTDNKVRKEPSRDLSDYVGRDFGLRIGRYVGAARRLYFELPAGTIIVVPGKNYYDNVLVGELVGKPEMFARRGLYDGEPVPTRKIKWLRRRPRSAFRMEVRNRFGTPNPLMQLERSLRGDILKAGFDQFAYDGEFAARLNTEKDEFNTLDDYNIQTFVNYVTGLLVANELGHTNKLSLADAIKVLREHPEYAPSLAQNINSIGFQRLIDDTVRPIVIAAFLSVALTGSATAQTVGHGHLPAITVTNSAATKGDPCKIEVAKRVEGALKLMKVDEWERVCEHARDAHASTGLSTTMRVKKGGAVKR